MTSHHSSEDDDDDDDSIMDEEEDDDDSSSSRRRRRRAWPILNWLAVFGDSTTALVLSTSLLVAAVAVAWRLESATTTTTTTTEEEENNWSPETQAAYRALGPIPRTGPAQVHLWDDDGVVLSRELLHKFEQDGVIAIRGLLDPWLLNQLEDASLELVQRRRMSQRSTKPKSLHGKPSSKNKGTQFHTVHQGAIFWNLTAADNSDETTTDPAVAMEHNPFLKVALESKIPRVAAELLYQHTAATEDTAIPEESNASIPPPTQNLRLLRDIFLAKDQDEYICGWHVDDTGFWPANAQAPGVNAWLALDDMPTESGGGFALAIGSHVADWKEQAYHVTGSTHTYPHEGFSSAMDVLQRREGTGTCNMEMAAPHLHRRMEETKRVYDIQKGDVIFHTRWLFHRTVPFVNAPSTEDQEEVNTIYKRYSIRYGPGWSEIPPGYGTEPSVLWDDKNGGRTADQVAALDAAWYPQVWPTTLHGELEQLLEIADKRLPSVLEQAEARRKEIRQLRRSASRREYPQPH